MPTLAEQTTNSPAAQKPHGKISRTLRCIAFQESHNLYVAECIDLNLLVKAKSMKQAIESLHEAISGYLAVACDGDMAGLIPRPSPLKRRIRYHAIEMQSRIARLLRRDSISKREPQRFVYPECNAAA